MQSELLAASLNKQKVSKTNQKSVLLKPSSYLGTADSINASECYSKLMLAVTKAVEKALFSLHIYEYSLLFAKILVFGLSPHIVLCTDVCVINIEVNRFSNTLGYTIFKIQRKKSQDPRRRGKDGSPIRGSGKKQARTVLIRGTLVYCRRLEI